MPLNPESLYVQLGHLIATMPVIAPTGPLSHDTHRWLGRAYALVNESGEMIDAATMRTQVDRLNTAARDHAVQHIQALLFRVLAVAELRAPIASQGAFIPAGNAFDAMAAVGSVLATADTDILIVDPYMDEKALTDFATMAPVGIQLRLLADQRDHKISLKPAVIRWAAQFGTHRPIEARLAAPRSLHDRMIAIDGISTWVLTQSLNALAARSPASIVRSDSETAALKVGAYDAMWQAASPL